jgi:nucleotide-binding universal stress UspA family protein
MRNLFPVHCFASRGQPSMKRLRALRPIRAALSSEGLRLGAILLAGCAVLQAHAPLAAQDDPDATAQQAASPVEERRRPAPINIMITVPRGEVNEAEMQECEDEADAGTISGDIIVCRARGSSGENRFSSREEAQRRYAEQTAFKDAPPPPDMFGIPDNGKGIGIGGVPPPALIIDVEALPQAPAGSDADRIARGLPALGQEELSEEEIRKRRKALGLPPPKFEKRPD